MNVTTIRDPASQNSHSPRSSKIGSVHPNRSPPRKQMPPPIDETQPVHEFDGHLEPQRPLKSCMSSGNLAGSLDQMDRVASAPNLSNMHRPAKRNVSFSKVEIREYERTLGDHPSVSSGPPIALGWNYNKDHLVFCVDEYEGNKMPRSRAEMLMPRAVREVVLKEYWGVSRSEMNATSRDINITKRGRRATARSSEKTEQRREQVERASRTVKRIVSLGKKKDEKKLWKDVKTMCGKRVYSMNDLSAYITLRENLGTRTITDTTIVAEPDETSPTEEDRNANGIKQIITEVNDKAPFGSQDSLSSSGNESATSLPASILDCDNEWGFGLDEDYD